MRNFNLRNLDSFRRGDTHGQAATTRAVVRGREGARGRGDSARAHERGVHEVVDEHVEALDVRVLRRHHLVHNVAALQLQLRQCLQAGRRAPFIRLRHARVRKGLGGRAA